MSNSHIDSVKHLTARRSYEFQPDNLRLSALSTQPVEQRLVQAFHFRTAVMGAPIPTFGDVPNTYPPGYVFDMGYWLSPQGELVPIRFIHIEVQRIVIDVAGDSSALTAIYGTMREAVADIILSGGSPIIGEPEAVLDYSEISAHCDFDLDVILSSRLRRLYSQYSGSNQSDRTVLVPSLTLAVQDTKQVYSPVAAAKAFNFTIRTGTQPNEHIWFSAAPLDSDAHLAYLAEFVKAIAN
jgi:hypothetical protein